MELDAQKSKTVRSLADTKIETRGVVMTDRGWGDTSIKAPEEYVSKHSGSIHHLRDGQIVQLEIREERKSFLYKLNRINRDDHMEYNFKPSYGSSLSSSRQVSVFEPDDGWKSTSYYYGMQDKIDSTDFNVYWVSDNYLLTQFDREELALSVTI